MAVREPGWNYRCSSAWMHWLMTLVAAAPAALLTLTSLSQPVEHDSWHILIEQKETLILFVQYNICLYLDG